MYCSFHISGEINEYQRLGPGVAATINATRTIFRDTCVGGVPNVRVSITLKVSFGAFTSSPKAVNVS